MVRHHNKHLQHLMVSHKVCRNKRLAKPHNRLLNKRRKLSLAMRLMILMTIFRFRGYLGYIM
jgi:hypothetical protein